LVAQDLFASALGDEIDAAWKCGGGLAEVLPEEDAAGLGPFEVERDGVFEDAGGVGKEAAIPEIGAAAFEDVDGFGFGVGSMEIEAEGAGGFVFAVDDDQVGGF